MTSHAGRIKEMAEVMPDSGRLRDGEHRHRICTLLRDKVAAAQREEATSVA